MRLLMSSARFGLVCSAFILLSINLSFSANHSLLSVDPNEKGEVKTIVYDNAKGLSRQGLPQGLKSIEVFDKSKRKVLSLHKIKKAIYLNTLKPGSYKLVLTLEDGSEVRMKLIKL